MAYQCIPLTTKEYKATLAKLMETSSKAKKFNNFNDKYKSITKAIRALKELESDKHLSSIISDLKQQQTLYQESMAKMLDTVYRAMQREQKKND
jgi:Sec7-like guanine-nucleotide exchange factor